jgi:uncharacterized protein (TIRG00374 family)
MGRVTPFSPRAKRWLHVLAWLGATALLAFLARRVDPARAWRLARDVEPLWLLGALACNGLILPCWAQQWRMLLPPARGVPMKRMLPLVAVMSFMGNTVPASGQVSAVVMLAREPGVDHTSALSTLALDQLAEGIAKISVLLLVAQLLSPPEWMRMATQLLALVVGVLMMALLLAAHRQADMMRWGARHRGTSILNRCITFVTRWSHELESLRDYRRFAAALGCAFAAKGSEALGIVAVQHAFGVAVSPSVAIMVLAAAFLGSIVPAVPANIGTFEAAVVSAYRHVGVAPETALALAVVQHLCVLLSTAGVGYLVFTARRFSPWREVLNDR